MVMSKSKIAPRNRLSVPRLELNGAVLSKRLEEFLVSHLEQEFDNIYHLVDSSTVLGYVHKADSKLKPFEGIRVSEIQTAGQFIDGRLHNWSWVEGENNPADWATKPRSVDELKSEGFWQRGPSFLTEEYDNWPVKLDFRTERLDGELIAKGVHMVFFISEDMLVKFRELIEKFSSIQKLMNIVAYMFKWLDIVKEPKEKPVDSKSVKSEKKRAREFWIRVVQSDIADELEKSVSPDVSTNKIHGKFRRLSPYKDDQGLWRVGVRLREFTPFTEDNKPPVLLPKDNRFTYLLMRESHEKSHEGVNRTVGRFRLSGYWASQAVKLARLVKRRCVICRYLDLHPVGQLMGSIPADRLVNPVAWGDVELDLFGPFLCRSDVNKRSSMKVWGVVIEDRNSGAVHCDVVLDYSAQEVIKMLRRFGSLHGWPSRISSDPGSQLESSSGRMEVWWEQMKDQLVGFAGQSNFTWEISPANSPWRQGRCEVRIKNIKRILKISIGSSKLSPIELQTVLFEAANMSNERPIGVNKSPQSDGTYKILTPNCLIIGRSTSSIPDDTNLAGHLKKSERYELIQQVTKDFWSRWVAEVTPEAVIRQKWHESRRNLQPGDVVLIHDKTPLKGKYLLAVVDSVNMSRDGLVRSCSVKYRIPKQSDSVSEYSGGRLITLTRSVQRLTLLLPVEEQQKPVEVEDNIVKEVEMEEPGDYDKINHDDVGQRDIDVIKSVDQKVNVEVIEDVDKIIAVDKEVIKEETIIGQSDTNPVNDNVVQQCDKKISKQRKKKEKWVLNKQ